MNKSALDYLRALPEIFTLGGLCRITGMSPGAATVYLHRWKSKDLIEAAGERAGIYFNRIKLAEVTSEHRIEVLRYEYPSAVLCGESVLHVAGWITQIPQQETVAVLRRPTYLSLNGFDLRGKTEDWFRRVSPYIDMECNTLRSLSPAIALADLYSTSGAWQPDFDDLDIDECDKPKIIEAFNALGTDVPASLHDFLHSAQGQGKRNGYKPWVSDFHD